MKKSYKIALVFLITIAIGCGSHLLAGVRFHIPGLPDYFFGLALMILLSVVAIIVYEKKNLLEFSFRMPAFRRIWRPVFYIILILALAIASMLGISSISGWVGNIGTSVPSEPEETNLIRSLVFGVIIAPAARELLFRGFLLNALKPLIPGGVSIKKTSFTYAVILSAFMGILTRFTAFDEGGSLMPILLMLVTNFFVGIVSGYFQEKYQNFAYALIAAMVVPAVGLLGFI